MFRHKMQFVIMSAVTGLLWTSLMVSGETWHLGRDQNWNALSKKNEDKYIAAVAEIKRLVNEGKTMPVCIAWDKFKKDFPEIAGPDFDAFFEAELLFCEGKFVKAVRAYDKFLDEFPDSKLYEAALDRQYSIATAFLAGQKKPILKIFKIKGYAEGAKIMERIADRAGDAPVGLKAALTVAESYERRGKFNEAYHKWSQIMSQWPSGQTGKEALLSMGRCQHAAYRGPKYDSSSLISAKSYYENFRLRYPAESSKFDIDRKLKQIDEQLAYKQFSIGQYYQQSGSKQASNAYYRMIIDNWPDSTAAKMAKQAMNEEKTVGKKGKKWKKNIIEKLEKLLL